MMKSAQQKDSSSPSDQEYDSNDENPFKLHYTM